MVRVIHTNTGTSPRHESDVELAQLAAEGDPSSRRAIVERLFDRIRVTVWHLAAGHPDADDYAQLATIEILQSIGSFRGESSLESWSERIAVRTALRHIKRHRWRSQFVALESEWEGSEESGGEEEITQRRISARIAALLSGLKPKQRAVITLKLVLGHSIEEIAAMTDTNVNTVKYRLRMGRNQLRKQILRDSVLSEWYKNVADEK